MKANFRSAVFLVPVKGNRVLLSRRHNTGWEDGSFSLVSGHIELNEPPTSAMIRESMEEAGISVAAEDLDCVQVVHRRCNEELVYIDYFFLCRNWEGTPENKETHKCSGVEWHDFDALPVNTMAYVREVLRRIKSGKRGLLEYNWNGSNTR